MVFNCMRKYSFPLVIIIFIATGCASTRNKGEVIDAQYYFDRGMEMMKKKDYVKAITDFQTVVESYSASAIVDHAQFMLAEAHYMNEEYLVAAYEYERVYTDYPSSLWGPEAQYKKALCYYMESPVAMLDQGNTLLAIDEFNRFIDNYPRNSLVSDAQKRIEELTAKLARKEYMNAEQYKKMKHYDAALLYYRDVIDKYPRTIWADYAIYGIGEVLFNQKEYEKAKEMFMRIVNDDVDMELKNKASRKLEEVENHE